MKFTVLGASGFIGSHVAARLRARGDEVASPPRNLWPEIADETALGHVIYCIGITADFRTRPIETVQAHVCQLAELLRRGSFESLLYLSSTRVYAGAERGVEEATFRVDPACPDDVYNLSKLMGESLCLAIPNEKVRVARLSNVFGPDWGSRNFLATVIAEAVDAGALVFRTAADSEKDYIGIDAVVDALLAISERGTERIYNVAAGRNVTNAALAARLSEVSGCRVRFEEGAPSIVFPSIECRRIRRIAEADPLSVLDAIPSLVDDYSRWKNR
jgi:nucleoside-diphosphate-sugar epimerase